jgi:hypothetical protein
MAHAKATIATAHKILTAAYQVKRPADGVHQASTIAQ